jgi:septal ring factor EnvC (AmiA/AmiB activator)
MEKGSLDRSLVRLEEDNIDMQKQIQQLQAQLAEAEQQHAQRYTCKFNLHLSYFM